MTTTCDSLGLKFWQHPLGWEKGTQLETFWWRVFKTLTHNLNAIQDMIHMIHVRVTVDLKNGARPKSAKQIATQNPCSLIKSGSVSLKFLKFHCDAAFLPCSMTGCSLVKSTSLHQRTNYSWCMLMWVNVSWLVVSTPLKHISQWEGWHPIYYGKLKMFQTTNQWVIQYIPPISLLLMVVSLKIFIDFPLPSRNWSLLEGSPLPAFSLSTTVSVSLRRCAPTWGTINWTTATKKWSKTSG